MKNKETKLKGSYNFSKITYKILRKVTQITLEDRGNKFKEWFTYPHKLSKEEDEFLQKLIDKEQKYLQFYNEELLKARFIIPILNKVDFFTDKFRDWYDYFISGIVNCYELSGNVDFMVATGRIEPEKPYFFIQEFKRSKTNSNPDFQVLAEMAVAIEINNTNILRGVFNIGRHWYFVILEKTKTGKYQYYESDSFDSLKINDLKQIYINLQAVKYKYCK